jgi:acid phosphatase (class A)
MKVFGRFAATALILCLAVCAPVVSIAQDGHAAGTYVDILTLPPELLPPPPEEGSADWKQQIGEVLQAQKHIPKTDLAAMKAEQHVRLELITNVIGGDFVREHLPKTFMLLDHVLADTAAISEADKQFWNLRRPYLTDHRVKLLINRIDASPAYPSGHASETRVLAEVIGMLKPGQRQALRDRADDIAEHRIEAGVHYPDDLRGGRILAMMIVGAMLNNPTFRDDLASAREEIGTAQ